MSDVQSGTTRAPAIMSENGSATFRDAAAALRPAVSHHPWLIGKNEQEEHGEVTRPDQELAEEKKEKEPLKLSRSPDPVSNDTKHRDRLEDHGNKIQAVGIVELAELIMMRQPAAAVEKAIHPDGADQGDRGINDRLGFQKLEVSEALDLAREWD